MKVLVDTDAGVDDSLAILTLLAAPAVQLVGVGTVFGNCDEAQAASNVLTTFEVAGVSSVPVCVGEKRTGPNPNAPSPHGRDGLGDRGLRPARLEVADESAVVQMLRVTNELEGQAHLLCLGPLTNVAAVLRSDSSALSRFASVTIMGGMGTQEDSASVLAACPQFLVKGDTNTNHDPVAAAVVAEAVGNVTWVGMNVTARLRVPLERLAESDTRVGEFTRTIVSDYSRYCTRMYGAEEPIFTAHDVVAAAVLIDDQVLLASTSAQPAVRMGDDRRSSLWGRTAVGQPTHRFAQDVDFARVLRRFDRVLRVGWFQGRTAR
ncbi:nucleoside hydrolase [Rhodococcus sp. NPDC058521]|uniref:nucleoside hydrolase n=1 Tax=Rhodococcus sp. NPDC058521 TaxID=3346536 RepID=UPI00365D4E0D